MSILQLKFAIRWSCLCLLVRIHQLYLLIWNFLKIFHFRTVSNRLYSTLKVPHSTQKNNQNLSRYQNHMKKQMQSSAWKAKLKKHLDIDLKIKTINNTLALKSKCKQFQIQIFFCCSQNCMKKWIMIVYCFFSGSTLMKIYSFRFYASFCGNSESIYMVNVSL